jgi:hypothetical protein
MNATSAVVDTALDRNVKTKVLSAVTARNIDANASRFNA